VSLTELYGKYADRVQFLPIYIREAHPVDGWWMGKGLMGIITRRFAPKVALDVYDPKTMEERRQVAGQCEATLQYGIRTYVDEMDDAVNKAYAAHPTRLYLIGLDGRVVYAAGLGPYDFHPRKLGDALEAYLGQLREETEPMAHRPA